MQYAANKLSSRNNKSKLVTRFVTDLDYLLIFVFYPLQY